MSSFDDNVWLVSENDAEVPKESTVSFLEKTCGTAACIARRDLAE